MDNVTTGVKTKNKISNKLNKRTTSEKIVRLIASVFFIIWGVTLLYPLFFGLNVALKENGRAFMADPMSIVVFKNPAWQNFKLAFVRIECNETSFMRMILNSLFFATIPTFVALFFTCAIGYIVSKYKKYRVLRYVYTFILVIQFIPLYGTLPATYKLFANLGFINSYSIVIASFGCSFGHFLFTYAFFVGVPWEYAESAFMDGAGHWRVFLQIMLPQIIPSAAVLYVSSFIATWNNFETCMLYYADKIPTLSYGIYAFYQASVYAANQPIYMAACLLASVPSIVLFLIFQNSMMTKLTFSGLKG